MAGKKWVSQLDKDHLRAVALEERKVEQENIKAQALEKILLDLWTGDNGKLDPERNNRIKKCAEGIIYCHSTPRPKKAGDEQDAWDRHYLAREVRLEDFFPPKKCMEIFAETCENQNIKDERRDPTITAKIVNVRRHLMPNTYHGGESGTRKNPLVDCTIKFPIAIDLMPEKYWAKINGDLAKFGVPEKLLPCPSSRSELLEYPKNFRSIGHTVHTKISNMCIAARGYHPSGMVPQEKGTYAELRPGARQDAIMGLRTQDADNFMRTEGKHLSIPRIQGDKRKSAYLNHMCGLSTVEQPEDPDLRIGHADWKPAKERFGSISFFLNATPKSSKSKSKSSSWLPGSRVHGPHGGILDDYRKVLAYAKTKVGLKKISAMLHPVRSIDPSGDEKTAFSGKTLVEEDFNYRTSGIKDWSKVTQEQIEKAVFYGKSKNDPVNSGPHTVGGIMISAACIGTIDGSAVRGTSKDIRRKRIIQELRKRNPSLGLGNRKSIAETVSPTSRSPW